VPFVFWGFYFLKFCSNAEVCIFRGFLKKYLIVKNINKGVTIVFMPASYLLFVGMLKPNLFNSEIFEMRGSNIKKERPADKLDAGNG
jgi:formate hydrogenlyase subunit 3/multisubunit Na+/H+ antiporter MnhD subunit